MDETFHFLCSALSLEACVPAYMDSAFCIRLAESPGSPGSISLGLSHVFALLDLVTATWPGGTGVLGRNVPLPKSTSHATASANLCAEEKKCDSPWCMNLTQICQAFWCSLSPGRRCHSAVTRGPLCVLAL